MNNIFNFLKFYFNQRPISVGFVVLCLIINILLIINTNGSDIIILIGTTLASIFFILSLIFCYKFEYKHEIN